MSGPRLTPRLRPDDEQSEEGDEDERTGPFGLYACEENTGGK